VSSVTLTWTDPSTGEPEERTLPLPATLGRAPGNTLVLGSHRVLAGHAVLRMDAAGLVIEDAGSKNGVLVEGTRVASAVVRPGSTITIGPFHLVVGSGEPLRRSHATILVPEDLAARPQPTPVMPVEAWPPPVFAEPAVRLDVLAQSGLPGTASDYLTLGAGLGSFIWADHLAVRGARPEQMAAIGIESIPHARYRRLCLNSQIADHERLRSNSESTPDNIWGWPGYGAREAWSEARSGRVLTAASILLRILGEPALAETYTPRAFDVYVGIDREAARIGWPRIYRYGRIRALRKTTDGRYVVAYSGADGHAVHVASHLHLATGYPALQFLPDLQRYRETTGDFQGVVNAYEHHDHVYAHLRQHGGTVLLRGRGIVASRLLQRLWEERRHNPRIQVIHLLRTPLDRGHRYKLARRKVKNHFELQPFNWPKACFGGGLRATLEHATPEERKQLLTDWGGTTTAPRSDWEAIVDEGLAQGWYRVCFGEVAAVERGQDGTLWTTVKTHAQGPIRLGASFIVDATGLDARVMANPLLRDLVEHHGLPLNMMGRLAVESDFELLAMRNGPGRMYAAGSMTLGGPLAPVDSFLGLAFAAQRSADALSALGAPGLRRLGPVRSLSQFARWSRGAPP
jgi:pSer/pThr/pTyr-binding forkhead associated (FHA) protein